MLPTEDIERARAAHWIYGKTVALTGRGKGQTGRCPFHEDKSPSFAVRVGRWTCFAGCGSGDTIEFVMKLDGCGFTEAVKKLAGSPHRVDSRPSPANTARTPTARPAGSYGDLRPVREIIAGCGPVVAGTPAWLYLHLRGLPTTQPALLAHPALYCHETGTKLPALVAPLIDSAGEICAVQQIWCLPSIEFVDGQGPTDSRAPLQVRKKTRGEMRDAMVRLAPAGPVLGIAEGVETAIAASVLYRVPVWAACGASRLPYVWIPPEVQRLVVFGDNGEAGVSAAWAAVNKHMERGLRALVIFPREGFDDFNTMLRAGR